MSEETPAAPVAEDQTATDPRLEQAQTAETPAAEAEAEAPEAEAAPEDGEQAAPEEPKKPKKTVEEALKGRVGHLTKTLSTKDAELAEAKRQLEAAQALLASRQAPDGSETPPAAPDYGQAPQNGQRTYTQAEFEQQVAAKAAADAFNAAANAMYDSGAAKFTDWKDSVDTLNAVGIMNPVFLDAAMATDDGATVIHHLGSDLEEATRIANLPPNRMAAELTKLAIKLSAPKRTPISNAPAPIRGVTGAVTPSIDLERAATDGGNDMSAYVAARAKQGARWAKGRGVN